MHAEQKSFKILFYRTYRALGHFPKCFCTFSFTRKVDKQSSTDQA